MKAFYKSLSIVLVITALTSVAEARGGHGRRGQFKEEIFKQLDLTPEQQTKLEELKSNRENMKALRQEKKQAQQKFREALAKDANESDLRALHAQKVAIRDKMEEARFEKMLAVRKVLTPAQRSKFQELMKAKRGQGRGKWKGGDQ